MAYYIHMSNNRKEEEKREEMRRRSNWHLKQQAGDLDIKGRINTICKKIETLRDHEFLEIDDYPKLKEIIKQLKEIQIKYKTDDPQLKLEA